MRFMAILILLLVLLMGLLLAGAGLSQNTTNGTTSLAPTNFRLNFMHEKQKNGQTSTKATIAAEKP